MLGTTTARVSAYDRIIHLRCENGSNIALVLNLHFPVALREVTNEILYFFISEVY